MSRRRRLGCVVVLLLALTNPARAQECGDAPETSQPVVQLAPDRHTVESSFRAFVAAPVRAVARELVDPSRLPEWVPGLVTTTALPDGFSAEWHLPWPLGRVVEVVRSEQRFEGADLLLRWSLVRGDLIHHTVCWRLRPIAADRTEVIYTGAVRFRRWVPSFLMRSAQRRALPGAIRRLERRAQEANHQEVREWSHMTASNASPRS